MTITTNGIGVQEWKSSSASSRTNTSGQRVTQITTYKWDEALSGLGVELFQNKTKIKDWKTGTDPSPAPSR